MTVINPTSLEETLLEEKLHQVAQARELVDHVDARCLVKKCSSCFVEASPESRFCALCGAPLTEVEGEETKAFDHGPPSNTSSLNRFAPGQILANRYRIVSRLGKGGMGEVYRADDLTLGQSVALKFLLTNALRDPTTLALFRQEVASARRVSHPNVCRVYDIAEHEGQTFLTMEHIDGEDLASLLKRIGHLPADKAIEIAQQLCAGLAAVHEQGIIHRDLKPANVMLDGRGKARLTDFGLAAIVESGAHEDPRAGTPAYQSPEQLEGKEVTVRSDVFALGLVLYEIFTGKRAYAAETRGELLGMLKAGSLSKPSSHVSELHPEVDQAILRCLSPDPADRPQSAYEAMTFLPGGNPLAAALFSGRTPTPAAIAAAPVEGQIHPMLAVLLLLLLGASSWAVLWINDQVALARQVPNDLSPRELTKRARNLLAELNLDEPYADEVVGFGRDLRYENHLPPKGSPTERFQVMRETGEPPLLYFWYRRSPKRIVSTETAPTPWVGRYPGMIHRNQPRLIHSGEVCLILDVKGRLVELWAIPPRHLSPISKADWKANLLGAAGLDPIEIGKSEKKISSRPPPVYADETVAWEGHFPERKDLKAEIHAAAFRGKPVYFYVGDPKQADRIASQTEAAFGAYLVACLSMGIVLVFGGPLALRNLRSGRSNVRGAMRLGIFFVVSYLFAWAAQAHHSLDPGVEWFGYFLPTLGRICFNVLICVIAYLALEPLVRQRWAWRTISWNRLLEGRWKDPLVGRDVLVGTAAGGVTAMILVAGSLASSWVGGTASLRMKPVFTSGLEAISFQVLLLYPGFLVLFLMTWLSRLLQRESFALIGTLLIWSSFLIPSEKITVLGAVLVVVGFAGLLVVLLRFGWLAFLIAWFCDSILTHQYLGTDFNTWDFGIGLWSFGAVFGLALFGAWASVRQHRVFREETPATA